MSDTIDVVINVEDISSQLKAARSQLVSFKKELSDMPDMSGTFTEGIDRTIGAIELLQKKASEYDSSSSEPRRQTLASDQLSGLQDVNVSTQLFSQSGSFSVSLAKQMFGGLSAAAQAELNKSTAEIAAMIRSSLSSLRSKSVTGMARDLLLSPDAQHIYQSRMSHVTERQYEQYIEAQLPHVAPMHLLGEYQVARHGRHSQVSVTPSLQTVMPDSYLASYRAKAYQGPALSHEQQNQYMQHNYRELLRNEIMQNDAAARAARLVPGLMQRSNDNRPMLAQNITRQQFEDYRRNLWDDYVTRASGRESSRIDIFDPGLSDEERRRAYARMNSSSAGQVLKAMRATEEITADDAWGAPEVRGRFERLPREARRSQEQYEIAKHTFEGIAAKAAPSRVMISESPNTRLLGMTGKHNQFSDAVAVISLSGYDKNNMTHRAQLEHLLSGNPVSLPGSDKQYIAQNMHGTGEDAVLRMVEAEAYRTVAERELQWLKDVGLIAQDGSTGMSGTNYWNNFIRENMDFGSIQGLRRHYDATGKGWTPGHDIEANLQNRKFAMVDFSRMSGDKRQRFADGLAWLGKGILPQGSIQGRFAVAGKGTLHQLNHKTLGDWARSVGLIGAEERFILPGIHGDVDLTDMHGMFDVSQIKNLPAYEHFTTSDAANDAFTKMIRRYGISSMTTYDDSETRSKGIGAQAMMFMKLPQSMQDAQAQEYHRRINALMTETGIRTFILGGEDNPIRAQLEAGEIDITNPQITSMVEREKESLQRRMIAGEWIDFSDSGQVINQKINKTPITSLFELSGLSRAEQIAQLRARMQAKGFTDTYTDEDIAGIWGLGGVQGGAIVDFTKPDAELVAINRSPNGFGQFVYGRNYANQAKAVYEAFGITPQGVYVSEEDMFRLGDADYDGDGAKTIYGDLAIAMRDTAVLHEQLRSSMRNVGQAREKILDYGDQTRGFSDTAAQRRLAIESSLAAAAAMGLTSGAGEKAAQFDLSDERNRQMLTAAIQAERAYSIATAGFKNASEVEQTPEMLATNVLGRKWQFLPTKFSRIFNTTGQDGLDVPKAEDVFMATVDGKQIPINMAELRKLNIDRTNLPSINQDSVVMGIRAASAMGPQGDSIQQMLAVEQALDQGIGYGSLGEASIRLLRNMRAMKLQTNAGLRGISTKEEAVLLEQQIAEARREINAQADALAIGNSGKVRLADGTEMSRDAFVKAAARAANIDIAENHLHQFGMTQAAVEQRFGTDGTNAVEQMQPKDGITLPTKATPPDSIVPREPAQAAPAPAPKPKPAETTPERPEAAASHVRDNSTRAQTPDSPPLKTVCPQCGTAYDAALGACPNCSTDRSVQPAKSLREFLSSVQDDMNENGLPQEEAARQITQWYNDHIPANQDPIMIDDSTSAKILERYLLDGTIDPVHDYAVEVPTGDSAEAAGEKNIQMSDLESFRQIEGSRAVYEDMMSAMRQTSSKWYGMAANQDENPEYGFYSKAMHQLKNARLRFDNALQNGDASMFGADTALGTDLRNQLGLMQENYFAATRANLSKSGDNAFEELRSSVAGTGDEFDKQLVKLEKWSKAVEKQEQQLAAFKKAREEMPSESDADLDADRKAIEAQEARIEEAKKIADQGYADLLKDNNDTFTARFERLSESITGKIASPETKIRRTVETYKKLLSQDMKSLNEAYSKGQQGEDDYNARVADFLRLQNYADNDLYNEMMQRHEADEKRRAAAATKRIENLRTQGRRLNRNAWNNRGHGFLSRTIYEWESGKDQYDNRITSLKSEIEREKDILQRSSVDSDSYKAAEKNLASLNAQLADTESMARYFSSSMGAVSLTLINTSEAVGRVVSQFGRRMFHQAIQEAKRFVQEFDSAMTEIQMVTLKTDGEISRLASDLMQTAVEMKVSVSDVTAAATDLYRQGISDEEVNVRMEDVLKFAKVAGIKAEEASKIITTALSNNLVESSGEAMDALVAQGDAAATSAEEIAKGMQKSAASAKQAGVSYEQLVTMLTIITSKTQLGGNQAGTALQTLMYRLYRVNEGEDFYDENGNRIAANDASRALDQLGVKIYDDNGDARSAFDIMVDVANRWDDASNISQEMVLNALGAGRQRTNIATLIQGLSEDDGALLEKYMDLATGSEGVTDEKYLAYLDSLNASLTTVKNSFDQLVLSFEIGDTASGFLDFISQILQGLAAFNESSSALTTTLGALATAILTTAAVGAILRAAFGQVSGWVSLGVVVAAAAGLGIASAIGNRQIAGQQATPSEISEHTAERVSDYQKYNRIIEESEALLQKEVLTELEIETLQTNLDLLSDRFGTAATEQNDTANVLRSARKILDEEYARQVKGQAAALKTSIDTDLVTSYRSSDLLQKDLYAQLGYQYSSVTGKYYSGNGDFQPMHAADVHGFGDLAPAQQVFDDFQGTNYMTEEEGKNEKWSSQAFQYYYQSRILDLMLNNAISSGVLTDKASPYYDEFNTIGQSSLGYNNLLTLLTTSEFKKLSSADQRYWKNELDPLGTGDVEDLYQTARSKSSAAVWNMLDSLLNSSSISFDTITTAQQTEVVDDYIHPWLSALTSEEEADDISKYLKNTMADQNAQSWTGARISGWLGEQVDIITKTHLSGTESIYESYVPNRYKPQYTIVSPSGEVIKSGLYWQDVEAFRDAQTRVSGGSINMQDWVDRHPKLNDLPDIPQWQYTSVDGTIYTGLTKSEAEAIRKQDITDNIEHGYSDGNEFYTHDEAMSALDNWNKELEQIEDELLTTSANTQSANELLGILQKNKSEASSYSDVMWYRVFGMEKFLQSLPSVTNYDEAHAQMQAHVPEELWGLINFSLLGVLKQHAVSQMPRAASLSDIDQAARELLIENYAPDFAQDDQLGLIELASSYQDVDFSNVADIDNAGIITGFAKGMSYIDVLSMIDPSAVSALVANDPTGASPLEQSKTLEDWARLADISGWSTNESTANMFVHFDTLLQTWKDELALADENEKAINLQIKSTQNDLIGYANSIQDINDRLSQHYRQEPQFTEVSLAPETEPVTYIGLEGLADDEWQEQYDKEYAARQGKLTNAQVAEQALQRELFWLDSGYGYYLSDSSDVGFSLEETVVNYLSEPLKEGLAAADTDDAALKRRVDAFARMLVGEGLVTDGVLDLTKFNDLMSSTKYGDLTSLFQNIDGLANIVNSVVATDSSGNPLSSAGKYQLINDDVTLQTAGRSAWNAILGASGSYSSASALTNVNQAAYIKLLLDKFGSGKQQTEDEYKALSSVYGDTLIGKMQRQSLEWWDTTYSNGDVDETTGLFVLEDGALKSTSSSVKNWYASIQGTQRIASWENYLADAQEYNKSHTGKPFTNEETKYMDFLTSNLHYGFDGLTTLQALSGAKDIRSAVSSYGQRNYLRNDASMIEAYASYFPSLGDYISMSQILEENSTTSGTYTVDDLQTLEEGSEGYEAIDAALRAFNKTAEEAKDIVKSLNSEIANSESLYGDMSEEVLQNSLALKGNKREAAAARKNLNQLLTTAANNQYYRQRYRSGERDDETIASIVSQTGYDEDFVKEHSDQVEKMLDTMMESDIEEVQAQVSAYDQFLTKDIVDEIAVSMPEIKGVDGRVDFSEAVGRLTAESAAEQQALAASLSELGFNAQIVATDADGVMKYRIEVGDFTGLSGRKASGGGGGGGGKSAVEKLLEEQEREQKLWEHRRKMIQFEETRYQNAGELSNYAVMLKHEAEEIQRQIGLREKQMQQLKKQMSQTKEYSDDWYALRDAIMAGEEALSELLNDAEELDRTLEEVQQQILKMHTDLEGEVLGQIEAIIQKERDMLDGTVSMQETVLEAIRERYRKEWELMQEDLDKKRQALEEEISLIDERLQRRKDAEDEAAKYEELAELQRQLAFISMDSTRTKDQAELRDRIKELEEELAWDRAEDEAELQKAELQEQVDAYNDFENEYQKWLDEFLEDANNFSEEVNAVLAMNHEDMMNWLKENVEAFSLSLDETQEQMIQGWTDTFKQMRGIVDTYWEEIATILSSKDNFMEYMKQSDAYVYASEDERTQMEYNWSKMYDNWIAAKKVSDDALNWDHSDEPNSGSNASSGAQKKYVVAFGGWDKAGNWVSGVISEPTKYAMENQYRIRTAGLADVVRVDGKTTKIAKPVSEKPPVPPHKNLPTDFSQTALAYASGGYVDYTGIAMVHGSPSAPEAFLSAEDTALVRSMLDAWQFAATNPKMSNLNGIFGKAQSNSIGDVHITITEASFADDADYEEVAKRVGEAFTKELSKQGFRTAAFNF